MKKVVLQIVFIVLGIIYHTCEAQDTLRIITYNIDQGSDTTLQAIGELIRTYNPDFVALQEVDMYPSRDYVPQQHHKNFMAELSYYSNMQGVFGKAFDHPGGWDYGNAILTKHSFTKSESFKLPSSRGMETRGLLLIHTSIKGHPVCFACTHLSYESKNIRTLQLQKIKQLMRKQKENIQFVCGDFNSDISEDIVFPIMKQWKDALPENQNTFSSQPNNSYRLYKYDYILYNCKKAKKIKVLSNTIKCDEHYTDHCIGIVDIIIP